MPKRIQRKRTKGWRMPADTIYVGRPSKWGNPFNWQYWVRAAGWTPASASHLCVSQFDDCLAERDEPLDPDKSEAIARIRRDIEELRGKDLCCWCPLNQSCHADILLKEANENG